MKKKPVVYIIWVVWYLCCLLLCQGAAPTGMAKVSTIVVGISAFAPPFYLLYLSKKDAKTIKLVQIISIVSLVAFAVLFSLSILSVKWGATAGRVLDILFEIFCAPVICAQWVVGLFLWASLLWATILMLKKLDQSRPDQK